MAFANPYDPLPCSANGSVFLHGLNEIGAARWLKSTAWANQRADRNLIKPDEEDQRLRRESQQKLNDRLHVLNKRVYRSSVRTNVLAADNDLENCPENIPLFGF